MRNFFCELEAILFDLDQTLLDREAGARRWMEDLLDRAGATDSAERARLRLELLSADKGGYGDREAFSRRLAETFPQMGLTPEEFLEDFRSGLPQLIPMDARVPAFLRRQRGLRALGLITNGSSWTQRSKMRRAGLDAGFFDVILVSGEEGIAKPDPEIFRRALERLGGVRPEKALFVGDHPRNDIEGASSAGLKTCWVRLEGQPEPPQADWAVDGVCELEELLPPWSI
jgi:putative hydrolase of the HAD superfamily